VQTHGFTATIRRAMDRMPHSDDASDLAAASFDVAARKTGTAALDSSGPTNFPLPENALFLPLHES
ncbi:MAG: hypothetical protein ACREO6_03800, partial [Rudaea sp.]